MKPEAAIGILRHMKISYAGLAEDRTLVPARREQAATRLKAIDTAIVAITRMEEHDENIPNVGGAPRVDETAGGTGGMAVGAP